MLVEVVSVKGDHLGRVIRGGQAHHGHRALGGFDQRLRARLTLLPADAAVEEAGGLADVAAIAVGETGSVAGGVGANGVGGASVAIDGTVGLEDAPSFANANSSGSSDTFAQQSSFDSATGASTFAQQTSNTSTGGDAALAVGEDGSLFASANANANGDASITNAGYIGGNLFATAAGNASTSDVGKAVAECVQ